MASQNELFDIPMIASSNVSAISYGGNPATYSSGGIPQFSVVTADTGSGNNRDVKLTPNATTMPVGVVQNSTVLPGTGGSGAITAGDPAQVRMAGISKCVAGAAITYGALVMANSSGQVVTATAPGATNLFVVGMALTAAAAAGDLIEVLLMIGATQQVNA